MAEQQAFPASSPSSTSSRSSHEQALPAHSGGSAGRLTPYYSKLNTVATRPGQAVAFVEGWVGDRRVKPPPRAVPCAACRSIRRSCQWEDGAQSCVRCSKMGRACSGPQKRARETLDVYRSSASPPKIGPSSPVAKMDATQLSYSLTYHLVHLFLNYGDWLYFPGVDMIAFGAQFRGTRGRKEELDADHELLACVYMLSGTQLSNHSAIVGRSSPSLTIPAFGTFTAPSEVPNINRIGSLRRGALDCIVRQMTARVEVAIAGLATCASIDKAASRLGIIFMGLDTYIDDDFLSDRHRLLGYATREGAKLLERQDCVAAVREDMLRLVQSLGREELRHSYSAGSVSVVTLDLHDFLFGPPNPPAALPRFTPAEEVLLYGAECPVEQLYELCDRHADAVQAFYDRLARQLVYTPVNLIPSAVRQCWTAVDISSKYFHHKVGGVMRDERYIAISKERIARRPASIIANGWNEELLGVPVLWGAHRALLRCDPHVEGLQALLDESEWRLQDSLTRASADVQLILTLPMDPVGYYFSMARLTVTVSLFRGAPLDRWVRAHPDEARMLLDGLRFASFGLADAARLVNVIEALLAETDGSVDELATAFVHSALEELHRDGRTDSCVE